MAPFPNLLTDYSPSHPLAQAGPTSDRMQRIVRQIDNLPAFPKMALKLMELFAAEELDLLEVVKLISTDPAISMKVISLANSAHHGLRTPVTSIKKAVLLLGAEEIRRLILTVVIFHSMQQAIHKGPSEKGDELWLHSLACAAGAEMLGEMLEPSVKTEVFLSGLLHDVGRLVLKSYFAPESEQLEAQGESGPSRLEREDALFGCNHTLVGKWLAEKWRLPEDLVHVIWLHHLSAESLEHLEFAGSTRMIHIVRLADLIAHELMADRPFSQEDTEEQQALSEILGFHPSDHPGIIDRIGRRISECVALVEVPDNESSFYLKCLKGAHQNLKRLSTENALLHSFEEKNRRMEAILALQEKLLGADDMGTFLLKTAAHLQETLEPKEGVLYCEQEKRRSIDGVFWHMDTSPGLFDAPFGREEDGNAKNAIGGSPPEVSELLKGRVERFNNLLRERQSWFLFDSGYFILSFDTIQGIRGELALRIRDNAQLAGLTDEKRGLSHLTLVIAETMRRVAILRHAQESAEALSRVLSSNERFIRTIKTGTQRFESLFQRSNDAIILHDRQGRLLKLNQRAEHLIGPVERRAPTSDPEAEVLLKGQTAPAAERLRKAVTLADGTINEIQLQRKDGTAFHAAVTVNPLGKDSHLLQTVIRDITVEKNAQAALRAEKDRLAVTLCSIGDGVMATDKDGRITLLNRVAENLTGFSQEEVVGLPIGEVFRVIDARTRIPLEGLVETVMQSAKIAELPPHTLLIDRNGQERRVGDSIAPIIDSSGAIVGAVLVFRDITEKQRMEEELVKAQKHESLALLSSGIAHDFNNILTAISGQVTLAKMYLEPEDKAYQKLSQAEKAAFRAKDLTHQLLTFSRKGSLPLKQHASIRDIILDSVCFALRGSNIRHECSIPDDLSPVECDPGQINQVMNNLIINAEQSMPQGGNIGIKACNTRLDEDFHFALAKGEYVRITVRDEGTGISPENISRIFDPYFTTKTEGTGLGLATSYAIIRKHNGHIHVDSTPGKGSAFSVYLPASSGTIGHQEVSEKAAAQRGEGKILLMDDNAELKEVSREMLQRMGYQVMCARNGNEAVQQYQAALDSGGRFDIVILDLTVPGGMGAPETLEQLRKIDRDVTAVVSSGYVNHPVMADFGKAGFAASISKPYRISELSALLRKVLETRKIARMNA